MLSPAANLSFTKLSLFLVSREFDGLPVSWALSRFMKTTDGRNSRRAEQRAEGFLWASPSPLGRAGGSVGTGPPCSRCYCGSAHTHTHTLWETLLFNSTVILTLTGSFSLTSCDRWVRSSGVTGLLILTWGSVQRDPAACWEEEEDSVIMVTSSFDCCFANLGQNIKKAAEHSKSETRRQDRKRETLRLQ